MSKEISLQINNLLENYVDEVEKQVAKASTGVASATVNKLKKHSPVGRGMKHYRDGWKKQKVGKTGYRIYNANKPGLTHLLNDGHVIRNQSGEYGRVDGDKHITTQADWASEEFIKRVEKAL